MSGSSTSKGSKKWFMPPRVARWRKRPLIMPGHLRGCAGIPLSGQSLSNLQDYRRALLQLLFQTAPVAGGKGPVSKRLWPGNPGRPASGVARRLRSGATSPRHLSIAPLKKAASDSGKRRGGDPGFYLCGRYCGGVVARRRPWGRGEVYNLASGQETSILELATLINSLTDNDNNIEVQPAAAWDRSGKRYGSPDKARWS